jgi:phosphoribosylglycinamide formyltransferase 1
VTSRIEGSNPSGSANLGFNDVYESAASSALFSFPGFTAAGRFCTMKRIVILISGRGSNMEAIVRARAEEDWGAQIAGVISNRSDASGLAWAQAQGIATAVIEHRLFSDRTGFDAALAQCVQRFEPDLVVLAGFMRILGRDFVHTFEGRLINIHPSLLPAFTGLHTHKRALEAGCKWAGATVHLVTPELDHGPIVIQAAVPVLPTDTESTLAARVLAQEHVIYPRAVRWMLEDRLLMCDGRVTHTDGLPQFICSPLEEAKLISTHAPY